MEYKFKTGWVVPINTTVLSDIGIYKHGDIAHIYLWLVSQASHRVGTLGEVYFSKNYAHDIFQLTYKKYKKVLDKLIELKYVEVKERGNKGTVIKILHYKKLTSWNKTK